MTLDVCALLLLQTSVLELLGHSTPLGIAVLLILLGFSLFSWAIIFSKWSVFRRARAADSRFLGSFRKANGLDAMVAVGARFRPSPLVSVFDFGYEEVTRQVNSRGTVSNKLAL